MRNPFRRPKTEQRALWSSTLPTWSDVSAGHATVGWGADRALSLVPVFAANRLLAGTVSTLPLKTYRDLDGTKRPVAQAQLFRRLEDEGRLGPWLHQCMTSLGLRGNAFGHIVDRDGMEFPTQVEWLDPTAVRLDLETQGRRQWRVGNTVIPDRNMLHIPWFTLPGQVLGLSPIGAFASTISTGLAATKYGADWFENGGFPPGTFKNNQQTVDQDQANAIKARLAQAIRSRQPLVYGSDWDYTSVTVPPGEAQFIETTRMNATQVATIYGIPPEMIGGETGKSMTYQNVEQQQINFMVLSLRPWLVTLERAFSALLPNRQYVKFNADAVVRADIRTRWETHEIRRKIGAASIDEIRELEDQSPIPGGDDYTPLGANLTPPDLPTSGPASLRSVDGWAQPA
jgi:HK97 family phage portal protein